MHDDDNGGDPATRDLILSWVMSIVAAALLLLLFSRASWAHEDMPWYSTLRAPEGYSCCNERDCRPAPEARIRRDHWEVRIGEEWVAVPPDRVLRVENPTGEPHVCHVGRWIVCFVPSLGA